MGLANTLNSKNLGLVSLSVEYKLDPKRLDLVVR